MQFPIKDQHCQCTLFFKVNFRPLTKMKIHRDSVIYQKCSEHFCQDYFCVLMFNCVLNNNTFKLFLNKTFSSSHKLRMQCGCPFSHLTIVKPSANKLVLFEQKNGRRWDSNPGPLESNPVNPQPQNLLFTLTN